MGIHVKSLELEDLFKYLEGGFCYVRSLSWLKIVPTWLKIVPTWLKIV